MEQELQRIKRKIDEYYYFAKSIEDLQAQINELEYRKQGVKGVGFENVPGNPETMESKIIRLSEKQEALESEIDHTMIEMSVLRGELHLHILSAEDMHMIELYHRDKMTYEQIADFKGYAGKQVVARVMRRIYERLIDGL